MSTTTVLHAHPVRLPSPSVRTLCHPVWTCHSTGRHTWRERCDALLATGQAYSVVPPSIRQDLDVVVDPERGWRGQIPTWFGIPCRIGRVKVWLPAEENPGGYRDFSLLVLLPQEDLEDAPPFVFLGAQFLLEYRAKVALDGSFADNRGRLVIP